MMLVQHQSVLLKETIDAIAPRPGGIYADVTAGWGGHSEAILEASAPTGRLIAMDRDPQAVEATRKRLAPFGDRVSVVHGEFDRIQLVAKEAGADVVDGVVADLGVSSPQLDDRERGFSFMEPGPLDMRMDTSRGETAADLIDRLDDDALANVLYEYGEERRSRAIARSIKRAAHEGRLSNTTELRRAVVRVLGPHKSGRSDPATRTFQALRIAVNSELEQLRALMGLLPDLLADSAVAVVISFHSLEDRIVKEAFRGDERLVPLTKKPLVPSQQEKGDNPRARSAKLRAVRRLVRNATTEEDVA
jgi:16S rRNA (cytosine1402-N4)-methyltransferase